MDTNQPPEACQNRRNIVPVAIILLMGILYTVLDYIQPAEPWLSLLAFLPGVISFIILRLGGDSLLVLRLRFDKLSFTGLLTLGATSILLLPILASSTSWIGWHWLKALVYAPTSGIAQELYFRAALLPGLERVFNNRKTIALFIHSALFVGFHYRTFQAIPTLAIGLVVAAVLFFAGCGWGWQVQRDRTVFWAMLHHSTFLVLMSMFEWS
jgi:hypothetical protein